MKVLIAKNRFLGVLLLACVVSGTMNANSYENGEYRSDCYDCGDPLNPCAFDVQVQGGVDPILWRHRGTVFGFNGGIIPSTNAFFQIPEFSHLFRVPWIIGGQVGWAWDCNWRVFAEFNYVQANAKKNVLVQNFSASTVTLGLTPSKYKLFDGYVGARYYTQRMCDRVSFYIGAKVGFTHHKAIDFNATLFTVFGTTVVLAVPGTPLFKSNTSISGGGHIGADICVMGDLSFVLTAEVVASHGPRGAAVITLAPAVLGVSSLTLANVGTEVRFPVTAGLRYSF